MTSSKVKWNWTPVHQKAFDETKRLICKEVLLTYPNFSQKFDIHTDASKTQLGAVISQNNKPIAFYSRKLNPAQTRYTTTERELLSIVETLKEYKNILLGQKIDVYTDHQNLTYKKFNVERVMRWRLIIEEFNPNLIYIKGQNNLVADALSRLKLINNLNKLDKEETSIKPEQNAEYFGFRQDDLPQSASPITLRTIISHQQKDKNLMNLLKTSKDYCIKNFHGGTHLGRSYASKIK